MGRGSQTEGKRKFEIGREGEKGRQEREESKKREEKGNEGKKGEEENRKYIVRG